MKLKNFALVAILIAIAGVFLWWFTRPSAALPGKTLETTLPVKVTAANSLTSLPQVEKPLAPPVQPKAEITAPLPPVDVPSKNDPRANLDTAIVEATRLYESDDIVAFWVKFSSPHAAAQLQAESGKTIEQRAVELAQDLDQDPDKLSRIQSVVNIYNSTQGQTPTMSDDGNTAVYHTIVNDRKWQLTFKKQNGLWYIGDTHGGMIEEGPAN